MASGKKGKKPKGKTVPLTDFLQETSGVTQPTLNLRKSTASWADEVEDDYDGFESRSKNSNVVLPTAPKAARGFDDNSERIPHQPPYIAYISNLPYDVDEEDISEFFQEMKIANMRLPRDDRTSEGGKLKGFGYIEFEDRNSLIGAISVPDSTLKGRRIRIEVATNSENDRRRGGGRMDMNRDRPDRAETSTGDWRSGPRADPGPEERRDRGGFNRDREGGGGGFTRDREGGGGGFTRDRDGGGFNRDRDRDGPPSADRDKPGAWRDASDRPSFRESSDRPSFRDSGFSRDRDMDRDRRDDRDRDRGRGGDSDRRGGGGFGPPRRNYEDREDSRMTRGGGGGPPSARDRDPEPGMENRARPKLVLAPRTKPLEAAAAPGAEDEEAGEAPSAPPAAAAAATPVPAASIFGTAKPVDTAARERQIEERLAKESHDTPSTKKAPARDDRDDKDRDGDRRDWGRRKNDDGHHSDKDRDDDRQRERPNSRGPPAAPKKTVPPVAAAKKPVAAAAAAAAPPRSRDPDREREMPKVKEQEPPNFAASNKYAFLEAEGEVSD